MSTARAAEPHAAQRAPAPRPAWLPVAGLFLISVVVYAVLALRSPLPVLFPDEFRYSHLARGLADGTGSSWRGQPIDQSAALYVYFLAPAWAVFSSSVDAYHATKVMGTIALCAQVVPVWWLARDVLDDRRLALVPAVLSVLGTWMVTSAETVTEVLAFPLTTASLCCAVMALRWPGSGLGWVAFALLALATWARIQMAVLAPALLVAFLLDALREGDRREERIRAHAPYLIVAAGGFLLVALIALAAPDATGDYAGFFDLRPALREVLDKSALQLAELAAVAGLLPVLLAAGAVFSRDAWRDDRTGPLLAVFWPAALATVLLSGFFLAGYPAATSAIGRYVTYAVPLALVLAVVLVRERELLTRASYAVAALGALGFALRPAVQMIGEERATWGLAYRLHQLTGVGVAAGLMVVSLLLVGLVVLAARLPRRRAVLVAAAAVGLVLVVQSQAAWWQMTTTGQSFRGAMADDLEWVDHHAAGGDVALLAITQNAPQFDDIDFFNRRITQAYAPAAGILGRGIQGKVCSLSFDSRGLVVLGRGCGPTPHRLLINDPSARVTFQDERASWSEPHIGRLVEVDPARPPRARSLVVLPCPRRTPGYSASSPDIVPDDVPITCARDMTAALWLDAPAQLVVRYRGGARAESVEAGGQRFALPARVETTVRFGVPKGYTQQVVSQSWRSSAGTPTIAAVALDTGSGPDTPLA